jgi:hypothetical protein
MKTTDELKQMLFERVAEIQRGGLTRAYEEQVRYEIALLAVILEDDIDAEYWDAIEAAM